MENSYGIGVHNRYELFYDDDVDPLDLLKASEQKVKDNKQAEKENKGTTKGISKKSSILKKGLKPEVPAKIVDKTNTTGESRPPNRGPRNNDSRVKFSDREERNNRRNRSDDVNGSTRYEGGEGGRGRSDGEGRPRFDGETRPRYEGGENRPRYEGGENRPRFDGEGRGRGGRGRGMGRGRGRGRGSFATGPDGRGKREFDRQSGMVTSGVKAVDKREGSGSYNWGSDKDQIDDYQQQQQQQQQSPPQAVENETTELDTSTENVDKTPEDGAPATESDEGPKEEEQREMSLDEWKSLQKQRSRPQFNVRKAGEGETTTWKKTYVLKKKEEEEDDEDSEEEDEEEVTHGRRKVLLDIDFKFSDTPMRGRGRGRGRGGERGSRGGGERGGGGRGGERGERGGGSMGGRGSMAGGGERPSGMGGGRGDRSRGRGGSRQEAPRMDDEHDFPSLG